MDKTPSPYQERIFETVEAGRGDTVVNAVAGSGKTQTLVWSSDLITSKNALFAAFNKPIAEELAKRLPNIECRTIHSLGFSIVTKYLRQTYRIGKVKLDAYKYFDIVKEMVMAYHPELTVYSQKKRAHILTADGYRLTNVIKQYADFVRLTRGNVWRQLNFTAPPDYDKNRPAVHYLLTDEARQHMEGLLLCKEEDQLITIDQRFWLLNLPLSLLEPFASEIFFAAKYAGDGAIIPIDNWNIVMSGGEYDY